MLQRAVFAVPVLWMLGAGWTHRWMSEDGFIYLRVVRQIEAGNGPVFNAGERVEAYTGTLWVAMLTVLDITLPVRLEWISVLLGLGFTVLGVALAIKASRRLWPTDGDQFFLPLGSIVFVAVFPTWAYASGGLETGFVLGWLGACLWILAEWAEDDEHDLSTPKMIVLGLGWLVRPEMVLFSAAFLLLVLGFQWSRGGWSGRSRLVAAAIAIPVAYQIFRMGYFASVVANTAIAKEGSNFNIARGTRYFDDFVGPYHLWIPALALIAAGYVPLRKALGRARRSRGLAVAASFVVIGILNTAYIVVVGGDYHHGRMFLPAFFALCAPVAVVPATRRHLAGLVVAVWAVIAVFSMRPDQYQGDNWLANGFLAPRAFGNVTTDDIGWNDGGVNRNWYDGPAYYREGGLLLYVPSDIDVNDDIDLPYAALWGVGVSGYSVGTDFHILDLLGLADSFTAHIGSEPTLDGAIDRFPGHEKPLPSPWVAARVTAPGSRPDVENFPSFGTSPMIPDTTGDAFQEKVAWARAALQCDDIVELTESTRDELTAGRFVGNLFGSFRLTNFRIPADPEEAYHQFCGPETPREVIDVRSELSGTE